MTVRVFLNPITNSVNINVKREYKQFNFFNLFPTRVANCALWFLKLPHSEAKEQVIFNVNILRGSSSVLELLGTIGNSALAKYTIGDWCFHFFN